MTRTDEDIKTNKEEIKKLQDEYTNTVKEVIKLRDAQNKIYEEMIETKGM